VKVFSFGSQSVSPAIEIAANTTPSPALAPFGRCRWNRRGLGLPLLLPVTYSLLPFSCFRD